MTLSDLERPRATGPFSGGTLVYRMTYRTTNLGFVTWGKAFFWGGGVSHVRPS